MIKYTFLKSPCNDEFKYKKYLLNFQKLNLYSRKTENVQILFKGICANIYAKFLCKNCAICFILFKAFQRAIKSQNPITENGTNIDLVE